MSEIMTPGAPTAIPAGFASKSLAGGFPTIQLTDDEASQDIIRLTGALTIQNVLVVLPQPLFPSQVVGGSALGGSYSGPTGLGWMKIFQNLTTGNFTVTVGCLGGGTTHSVPQGQALWLFSPDGFNVFCVNGCVNTPP